MDAMSKTSLTFRLDTTKREALDQIAKSLERDRTAVLNEAIDAYLDTQAWQRRHIEQALAEARSPEARVVDHDEVDRWLQSWGTEDELAPPEARHHRS